MSTHTIAGDRHRDKSWRTITTASPHTPSLTRSLASATSTDTRTLACSLARLVAWFLSACTGGEILQEGSGRSREGPAQPEPQGADSTNSRRRRRALDTRHTRKVQHALAREWCVFLFCRLVLSFSCCIFRCVGTQAGSQPAPPSSLLLQSKADPCPAVEVAVMVPCLLLPRMNEPLLVDVCC